MSLLYTAKSYKDHNGQDKEDDDHHHHGKFCEGQSDKMKTKKKDACHSSVQISSKILFRVLWGLYNPFKFFHREKEIDHDSFKRHEPNNEGGHGEHLTGK